MAGLIFAYLGPQPAPLLPRWDLFVWDNVTREIQVTMLPCNWLQCIENSLDTAHNEWLHGVIGSWVLEQEGKSSDHLRMNRQHHVRMGFDRFKYGIIKRRMYEGDTENVQDWRIGHPVVMPNILRQGRSGDRHTFQFRVPIDDTHTWHVRYGVRVPKAGETVPPQDVVPVLEEPLYDNEGHLRVEQILEQDHMVWVAQGPISNRPIEHLGVSDIGIILYRRVLDEQMKIVEDGGDPINVFRNPAENTIHVLLQPHSFYPGYSEPGDHPSRCRSSAATGSC